MLYKDQNPRLGSGYTFVVFFVDYAVVFAVVLLMVPKTDVLMVLLALDTWVYPAGIQIPYYHDMYLKLNLEVENYQLNPKEAAWTRPILDSWSAKFAPWIVKLKIKNASAAVSSPGQMHMKS